jgi:nucleoside diphosphate kinase
MQPVYVDFNKLNFENYATKWTRVKREKIDDMYEEYEDKPVIFKKYLNKFLRNDPINNVICLSQHLKYLTQQVQDYNNTSYDDEHDLKYIEQYRDLVQEVLEDDLQWNEKKKRFPNYKFRYD